MGPTGMYRLRTSSQLHWLRAPHTNDIVLCVFHRRNLRMSMTAFNVVVSPVFSTLPLMMMMEDR